MMENNGECSQKRVSQQTTLNFPVLSYTHFDSSNKKGKNKLVDHIDHGEVANNEKETTPLKPIKQLKQITLNFPSITNNIRKKRFLVILILMIMVQILMKNPMMMNVAMMNIMQFRVMENLICVLRKRNYADINIFHD